MTDIVVTARAALALVQEAIKDVVGRAARRHAAQDGPRAKRGQRVPRATRRRTSRGASPTGPRRMWYVARSPMSRCCCRCLVLLLLFAVATGLSARPLKAATRPFADIVDAAARRHGVDPSLVHAVIAVESGYRANAQSPAGAQGLMQLMPGTQRQLGVSDAFDPQQNVDAGVAYLHRLTDEFGTVLALAAYNAGPGAVRRYNGIPPYKETRAYVQAVLDRAQPVAGAQAPEAQVSSEDRADAAAEADVAEGDPGGGRLQDDRLAADTGREPHALSETWELDGRVRTARLVLHHVADRLPADAGVRCEGPGLPVVAATQAQRRGARRRTDRRSPSSKELRAPTSGSEQRAPVGSSPSADRGADSLPRGPTATTPAAHRVGPLRVRPPPGLLALENPRSRSWGTTIRGLS